MHAHENTDRAPFRPAARGGCKLDSAEMLRLKDEADVELIGLAVKLAGVIVIVEESAPVTNCALRTSSGGMR